MDEFQLGQITIYESYFKASEKLKNAEDFRQFWRAVFGFGLYGVEPQGLNEIVGVAFEAIRPNLERSRLRAISGACGKGKSKTKQTEAKQSKTKQMEANAEQVKGEEKEQVKGEEKEEVQDKEQYVSSSVADSALTHIWLAYPAHRREDFELLRQAVKDAKIKDSDLDKIRANLEVWKKTMDWTEENGRFIPSLTKWVRSGQCLSRPAAAQLTSNPFLAMQMEMEGKV